MSQDKFVANPVATGYTIKSASAPGLYWNVAAGGVIQFTAATTQAFTFTSVGGGLYTISPAGTCWLCVTQVSSGGSISLVLATCDTTLGSQLWPLYDSTSYIPQPLY